VLHHGGQRGQRTVVHVGRGLRHIAQAGHFEFAEVVRLGLHVARLQHGLACRVVAEAGQQVVSTGAQCSDAAVATRVDHARSHKKRHADVAEFAMAETRADVAGAALAGADEQAQATLGRQGRARSCGGVTTGQCIAELIERRGGRHQRADENGNGLGAADQHPLGVVAYRGAKHLLPAARQIAVAVSSAMRRAAQPHRRVIRPSAPA
jgi:hypothetical protein